MMTAWSETVRPRPLKAPCDVVLRAEGPRQPLSVRLCTVIEVVEYEAVWPQRFERLRATLWPAVSHVAIAIEHVGSTSVPGLAAKPILDIDIIVPTSRASVESAIESLATAGYTHQGDLGVPDREAFKSADGVPRHNLYVCPKDSLALRNHLVVRDYLRAHPEVAREYGRLKRRLAARFPDDIDAYIAGKTDLICRILATSDIPASEIERIRRVNALPSRPSDG